MQNFKTTFQAKFLDKIFRQIFKSNFSRQNFEFNFLSKISEATCQYKV